MVWVWRECGIPRPAGEQRGANGRDDGGQCVVVARDIRTGSLNPPGVAPQDLRRAEVQDEMLEYIKDGRQLDAQAAPDRVVDGRAGSGVEGALYALAYLLTEREVGTASVIQPVMGIDIGRVSRCIRQRCSAAWRRLRVPCRLAGSSRRWPAQGLRCRHGHFGATVLPRPAAMCAPPKRRGQLNKVGIGRRSFSIPTVLMAMPCSRQMDTALSALARALVSESYTAVCSAEQAATIGQRHCQGNACQVVE